MESVSVNAQPGWSKIHIGIEAVGESGEPTSDEKSFGGLRRFCRLGGLYSQPQPFRFTHRYGPLVSTGKIADPRTV